MELYMQSTSASFPCWLSLCRQDLPRQSSFFYLFILELKCVKICKFYVIIESIELNELHFIVFLNRLEEARLRWW